MAPLGRARLLCAAVSLLLLLSNPANGLCNTVGCNAQHTNSEPNGEIPNNDAGPVLEAVIPVAVGDGTAVSHPALVSGDAAGMVFAIASNGNVTALRRDFAGPAASWAPPTPLTVLSAQAVITSESVLPYRSAGLAIILTRVGGSVEAWGLTAVQSTGSSTSAGITFLMEWGPVSLSDGGGAAGPLIAVGHIVYTSGRGGLWAVDGASGNATRLLDSTIFTCGGNADAPSSFTGPVLLSSSSSSSASAPDGNSSATTVIDALGLVTSQGCALGINVTRSSSDGGHSTGSMSARVVWRVAAPAAFTPTSSLSAGPPSCDVTIGHMYTLTVDAWACCYDVNAGGAPCAGWAGAATASPDGYCVSLGPPPYPLPPNGTAAPVVMPPSMSLVVSPVQPDFHGGSLYAVDARGWVWEVAVPTGFVSITARGLTSVGEEVAATTVQRPTPLLIPGGYMPTWHALLTVSPSGKVFALSAGDIGPSGDDDDYGETDDDGGVTTGLVWIASLPVGGLAAVTSPSISLTPEGRIVIPAGQALFVIGSSRDGSGTNPFIDTPLAADLALGLSLGLVAVALGVTMVVASRHRALEGRALQARALIRAAFLAEWGAIQRAEKEKAEKGDDDGEEGGEEASPSASSRRGGEGNGWDAVDAVGGAGAIPLATFASKSSGVTTSELEERLLPNR